MKDIRNKARRISAILSTVTIVLLLVGTQFVASVAAKKPEPSYNGQFTRVVGKLGGAGYELFMPDDWNGMLVIGVRGYAHAPTFNIEMSPMHAIGQNFFMNTPGHKWAYAWSTFGEGGFCVQKGMIRTHQLTEYIIDNYDVHGKVLLMGMSMGGLISCLLAEKYPNLYDGVLDICGLKDIKSLYEFQHDFTSLPSPLIDPEPTRDFLINGPLKIPEEIVKDIPVVADPGIPSLMSTRNLAMTAMADEELELGGTPETKPKAYERYSPTYHADITVPVLSMIGEHDTGVPPYQFKMYYDAVAEAGALDCYRSYTILGGGHVDPVTMAKFPEYWGKLVNWVMTGVAPA